MATHVCGAVTNGYITAVLPGWCVSVSSIPPPSVGSTRVGTDYVIMTVADADPTDLPHAQQVVTDAIFVSLMPQYCNLPRTANNCVTDLVKWLIITYDVNGQWVSSTCAASGCQTHPCAGFESRPPVITSQPFDQSVNSGQTATFSVGVSGATPLYYQWVFNGTNVLAGATNSALVLPQAQTNQAGTYEVQVYNAVGNTNSRLATLIVDPGPAATIGYITAVLRADGCTNAPISRPPPVGGTRVGTYYVIMTVADANPTDIENARQVVNDTVFESLMPQYCNLPRTIYNCLTDRVQWDIRTYDVNGQYVSGTCAASGCQYHSCAGFESGPPVITSQPFDQSVNSGQTATFSVGVSGATPLYYQWVFNGTNVLAGATNSALELTQAQTNQAGTYEVQVYNALGNTNSRSATLIVDPGPAATNGYITAVLRGDYCANAPSSPPPPVGGTRVGTNYVIMTVADADPTDFEQARRVVTDTIFASLMPQYCNLPRTNNNCVTDLVQWNIITYNVNGQPVISGCAASGCELHSCANFEPGLPVITSQPFDQSVNSGQTATFSVGVSGATPLYYQWVFNGTNVLAGATNSALVLPQAQTNQAGTYEIQVYNALGNTNSRPAILTVNPASVATNGYITAVLRSACADASLILPPPVGSTRVGANYVIMTVAIADPTDFEHARQVVTDAIFESLMPHYCNLPRTDNNCVTNLVQWSIITYNVNGQPVISGCAASGCQSHSCVGGGTQTLPPALTISSTNNNVELSWSSMASDFVLETSTNWVDWSPLTWPMSTNFDAITTRMPYQGNNQFFRLRHR